MYERFYGLESDPFRLSPDPRFCFEHRNFARARAYIDYALRRAEGFVMITGRPGTGKTTLIRDLVARLDGAGVRIATLESTQLGAEDLLRLCAYALGLDGGAPHKALVLHQIRETLDAERRRGRRALLIIDEAQDLHTEALEELRLLTNLQGAGQPLLQILLIGQEALRELVRSPALEQLHQRLVAAWHLEPLGPAETLGYVRHRLERAEWRGDPSFEPGVLRAIHDFSGGVPRRINLVCSRLLLHGFIEELHRIGAADAAEVLDELRQEELDPGALAAHSRALAEEMPLEDWALIDQGLARAPGEGAPPLSQVEAQRGPDPLEPGAPLEFAPSPEAAPASRASQRRSEPPPEPCPELPRAHSEAASYSPRSERPLEAKARATRRLDPWRLALALVLLGVSLGIATYQQAPPAWRLGMARTLESLAERAAERLGVWADVGLEQGQRGLQAALAALGSAAADGEPAPPGPEAP